jgi:hypothetical protein
MSEELTEEQAQEIIRNIGQDRHSVHSFLDNVASAKDSTKTGNVGIDELGMPQLPVRTYSELAIFCDEIADEPAWATYFNKMKQSNLSTSLSKDGFLIKAAITTKKELADVTQSPRKENSGWFKKKSNSPETSTP